MRQIIVLIFAAITLMACKKESNITSEEIKDDISTVPKTEVVEQIIEEIEEVKPSVAELKAQLTKDGFQIFDYVDEETKDTILMQQYFIAFLKRGPIRNQNEEEAKILQEEHLNHLGKMYDLGYADISGPFGDDGDIRGITIYNVPTQKMADSLANSDPMVKAGRLEIEIHPWWAAKGFSLR
ncbi:YciI family protein [Lacinutrix iliipiscaria]|uniref:YciI family protein n=1 Tax=Lacinutrix iliipiscaria TaxID=1230532 RepID=A0ABW5WMY8_9FLAO